MRILIVGSDANACTIAKAMSEDENMDMVFVASGCGGISNFAKKVNISETDNEELLDFAIANEISLTIVTSITAIENDIAGCFADARLQIFAPRADSALITLYKSAAKKTMYRLKIPTIKFGIFERENQALEYADGRRRPLVIKNDSHIPGERPVFTVSFPKAKNAIEHCFTFPENKIIIEDYIDASEVAMYFITDGYTALPIGSTSTEEHSSHPSSVFSPDSLVSDELEIKILNEVVYPIIDDMAAHSNPYCGILGVDLFVKDDVYNVIEFNPFFKQMHFQSILPLVKSNLYDLFLSAASGSLSDEYKCVDFYNCLALSELVDKSCLQSDMNTIQDDNVTYAITSSSNVILTQRAKTLGRAKTFIKENIEFLKEGQK